MLTSLLLPIILSAVALFFASFASWMVLKLHKQDWNKLPGGAEEDIMKSLSSNLTKPASYMFPFMEKPGQMDDPAFKEKFLKGPRGILTMFGPFSMGKNLGLTFLLFLAVSFALAYLATIALPAGAPFLTVFRFFATAAFLTFATGVVQYSIWFKNRITGYVIESLAYAVIVGAIFGAMWPAA